ncbi:MAG TPA: 50S ribosomal protein L25 [Anaerolineales bacterium]|nr:50S ribosomal protein L25 [Anaerolineales bacterium]
MESHKLKAEPRTVVGKRVGALRREGMLPAILYGAGISPQPVQLDAREAGKALARVSAATLLDLEVGDEVHKVLVREMQRDVIRRDLKHVDFLKVAMDVVIRTEVPVELVGEAPAVKLLAGVLVSGVDEIEVEALPSDLPDRISVDLSVLKNIDDAITVGDLFLGKGVKVLTDAGEVVAHVIYQAAEEVEVVEEVLPVEGEPEVIERARREEEAPGEGEGDRPPRPSS